METGTRERVVSGILCCLRYGDPKCSECPYDAIDLRCRVNLREDILKIFGETYDRTGLMNDTSWEKEMLYAIEHHLYKIEMPEE